MSITVANIVAQVGADLSQFRLGMNEVDARFNMIDIRGRQAAQRVDSMRNRATQLDKISGNATNLAQYNTQIRAQAQAQLALAKANLTAADSAVESAKVQLAASRSITVEGNVAKAALKAKIQEDALMLDMEKKNYQEYAVAVREANALVISSNRDAVHAQQVARATAARAGSLRGGADALEERAAGYTELDTAIALRRKQDATEHRTRAYNAIAGSAMTTGLVTEGALIGATVAGAGFNQMLLTTAHNTQLSAAGVALMNDTVIKFGLESGASLDDLAQGFRKFNDFGYSAQDTVKLLRVAMMASIATGTDLVTTSQILAGSMKNFKIPVSDATQAMGMMIAAGQESTLTMQELIDKGGPLYATASAMGLSFLQTNALLVLFTKHQLDASQAVTQLRNDINKIQNPSATVRKELALLTKETGVNLTNAFTIPGVRALTLVGVFDKLGEAYDKLTPKQRKMWDVNQPSDLAARMFPNLRGTVGALIASGNKGELHAQMDEMTKTSKDGANYNQLYATSLSNVNQQIGRMQNSGIILASSISTVLSPQVQDLASFITKLANEFNSLSKSDKDSIVAFTEIGGAFLIVAGGTTKLLIGLAQISTAIEIYKAKEAALALTNEGLADTIVADKLQFITFGNILKGFGWAAIATLVIDIGTHFWDLKLALDQASDASDRFHDSMTTLAKDGPGGAALATKDTLNNAITVAKEKIHKVYMDRQIDGGIIGNAMSSQFIQALGAIDFTMDTLRVPKNIRIPIDGMDINWRDDKSAMDFYGKEEGNIAYYKKLLQQYPSDKDIYAKAHTAYIKANPPEKNPMLNTDGDLYGAPPITAPDAGSLDLGNNKHKVPKLPWTSASNWWDNPKSDSVSWENYKDQLKSSMYSPKITKANNSASLFQYQGSEFNNIIPTPSTNLPRGFKATALPGEGIGMTPVYTPSNITNKETDEYNKTILALKAQLDTFNTKDISLTATQQKQAYISDAIDKLKQSNQTIFNDPNAISMQNDLIQKTTKQANDTFRSDEQIEAAKKLKEIQDQITTSTLAMTESMKHSTDQIKVTDAQWNLLSKDQQQALNKLKNMDDIKAQITNVMQGTAQVFQNSLDRLRTHGFKGFFNSIEQDFETMLFNLATKWLTSQFLQLMMNQLPSIMNAISGLGSGASAFASGGMSMGANGMFGSTYQTGLAIGGPIVKGQKYLVGEKGPEYITAREDGYVTPNNKLDGGGNITIIQHNSITSPNAGSFARTDSQNGMRAAAAARLASNRNR